LPCLKIWGEIKRRLPPMPGNLARIHFFSGQEVEGKQLMAEAKALDPFFSKATDVPGMQIYIPPGEIYRPREYSSFLRPF
jgi:hypothetical protein